MLSIFSFNLSLSLAPSLSRSISLILLSFSYSKFQELEVALFFFPLTSGLIKENECFLKQNLLRWAPVTRTKRPDQKKGLKFVAVNYILHFSYFSPFFT